MRFFEKIDDLILCRFPTIWKYKLHVLTIFVIVYLFLIKFLIKNPFFEKNKFIIEIFLPFLFLFTYLKYNAFYFFEDKINFKRNFFNYLKDFLALMYVSIIVYTLFDTIDIVTLNVNINDKLIIVLFLLLSNIISLKFLQLKKFFILYILGLVVLILFFKFSNFVEKNHYLLKLIGLMFLYSYEIYIIIIFIFLGLMLIYFLRKNSFVDLIYNLFLFVLFMIILILFKDNEILKNDKIGIIFLFLFCVMQYTGLIILNSFPKRA